MTAVALEDYAGSSFFLKGMAAPAPGTSHLRLLEDRASSCIKGMRVALKKMQLPQFKGDVSLATALPRNRPVPFSVFPPYPKTHARTRQHAHTYVEL